MIMHIHVLQRSVAEQSNYETVWLKHLGEEMQSDGISARFILSLCNQRLYSIFSVRGCTIYSRSYRQNLDCSAGPESSVHDVSCTMRCNNLLLTNHTETIWTICLCLPLFPPSKPHSSI
jgi:hypothetical protein